MSVLRLTNLHDKQDGKGWETDGIARVHRLSLSDSTRHSPFRGAQGNGRNAFYYCFARKATTKVLFRPVTYFVVDKTLNLMLRVGDYFPAKRPMISRACFAVIVIVMNGSVSASA